MANRALYSLIPLVVLGAGCSQLERLTGGDKYQGTTSKCTERHRCNVTVVVASCSSTGIVAKPEYLHVAHGLKDVPITWKLEAPAGYTFAEEGISFKNMEMARRQFQAPSRGSTEFKWVDRNSEPGRHAYNIKVRRDGKDCPVYDPVIINDP